MGFRKAKRLLSVARRGDGVPIYCYEHPNGTVYDRVFEAGKAPRSILVKGRVASRSYSAEATGVPAKKGWPMTCFASGVNANQAGELRDHLRKEGVATEVTPDGDPVYTDPAHRKRALRARGMVDKKSYI